MKLNFFGAARTVTGSCYLLQSERGNLLIDCGMRQGADVDSQYGESEFPFDPSDIDFALLSHAHIDHSGLLPLLVKRGFQGRIFCTEATADLCSIMLPDSGHIQEMEAEWHNRKLARAGKQPVPPLYTALDAKESLRHFQPVKYGERVKLNDAISVRFLDAGHMLGSSTIEVWAMEQGEEAKIAFSGDIGHGDRPIVKEPTPLESADYVIMEATYGDRLHGQAKSTEAELIRVLTDAFARGGNVVVPSFAVGRTQELLYFLSAIMRDNKMPLFPVYIDSPLGIEATRIFEKNSRGYYDDELMALVKQGINPFEFEMLRVARTVEESKRINEDRMPKVIISSSGMCEAGRIKHHLKHNLWRTDSTILFSGYQAVGTLGRSLLEGARRVRILGEDVSVNARIEKLEGLSGHADRDELLAWIEHVIPHPKKVFLVHGENDVLHSFGRLLRDSLQLDVSIPSMYEGFDLEREQIELSDLAVRAADTSGFGQEDFDKLFSEADRILAILRSAYAVSKRLPDAARDVRLGVMMEDIRMFADKWEGLLR